jgi:D-alanine-D-alanine ligase-like ATP-grasp enzyme
MRTVLVGSDFMYNKDGNLVPIEINTNVGWHNGKVESNEESIDLTELSNFITEQGFTKVVYIGNVTMIITK